jgi:hypothetical protein
MPPLPPVWGIARPHEPGDVARVRRQPRPSAFRDVSRMLKVPRADEWGTPPARGRSRPVATTCLCARLGTREGIRRCGRCPWLPRCCRWQGAAAHILEFGRRVGAHTRAIHHERERRAHPGKLTERAGRFAFVLVAGRILRVHARREHGTIGLSCPMPRNPCDMPVEPCRGVEMWGRGSGRLQR